MYVKTGKTCGEQPRRLLKFLAFIVKVQIKKTTLWKNSVSESQTSNRTKEILVSNDTKKEPEKSKTF